MDRDLESVRDTVRSWQHRRVELAQGFTRDGLRAFGDVHMALSRQLLSLVDVRDPDFWSAWIELGQQCSTFSHDAKTFLNGRDITNG